MSSQFLYQKLDNASEMGFLSKDIPLCLSLNLNPAFAIREYQQEAYSRFLYYFNSYPNKQLPIHLLYNMATGSGKTIIMAGLILYLYEQGYRNFLFFVNSNNIIQKTKANFIDNTSSKYLFNDKISFDNKIVKIKEVSNFSNAITDDICIKFTTIQGLHSDLNTPKENGLTYTDFEDKKIVILSDEAHHINSTTKKGNLSKSEEEEKKSWESTVMKILNSHSENVMLEFTATIDLSNEYIREKYTDKIIYKYDLKEFRLGGYSKEVDIYKSDMDQEERILQALILSQYRMKIAEDYKIHCKPVILFKAQKTVAESQANMQNFIEQIKSLSVKNIETLKSKADGVLQEAFMYFANKGISDTSLVSELQADFDEDACISANDDKESTENQILLNTLEDRNNRKRAIFAVQKLNEGWDVLNLFDIVRLYDSRSNVVDKKSGKIKVGPQTISEAQLIGRGARYFPFTTPEVGGDNKYQRKFDESNHELRILERFYYHTSFDNLYITEIKQALRDIGMMDEKEKKTMKLTLKKSFIDTDLYQQGVIYTNERREKSNDDKDSLQSVGIENYKTDFVIFSGTTDTTTVFAEEQSNSQKKIQSEAVSFDIKDINKNIIRKAIWKNSFYTFENIHKHIGGLQSMDQFMIGEQYLGSIKIVFQGLKDAIDRVTRVVKKQDYTTQEYSEVVERLLQAVSKVLIEIEPIIKNQDIRYEGTKEFKPRPLKSVFHPKKEIVDLGYQEISVDNDWFVFEKISGTSEEKAFIDYLNTKIADLKQKYDDVYLLRSERAFPLYSFDEGDRFEPDFVLFLRNKSSSDAVTYQVFIEPKGEGSYDENDRFELSKEGWKQKFLNQISDKAKILEFNFGNYKLIGLPFYNEKLEHEFDVAMKEKIL